MRIEIDVDISTLFQIGDTGYTREMTLPEIEKWALDRLRAITIFIKEGGTESKPVQGTFTIKQIRFQPEDKVVGFKNG